MVDKTSFWLAFSHVPGVGYVRITKLLDAFGDLERAWHADAHTLRRAGMGPKTVEAILKVRSELDLDQAHARLQQLGIRILTLFSPDYPESLREIQGPPAFLFVKGKLQKDDRLSVAIVGTRSASSYGTIVADRISGDLARIGLTIISGLARGIDGISHQAALDVDGRTLAVLGSGLDRIYPSEHRRLAEEICQHGALVSEYPPGTGPEGHHFPARNRIIAGLAMGVIVIEAAERSGALITANFAAEQGKEVFALPGDIRRKTSEGTNRLIQDGAHPLLDVSEVCEVLGIQSWKTAPMIDRYKPTDEIEAALLDIIGEESADIDHLFERTEYPIHKIQAALSMLELEGVIQAVGSRHYARIRESNIPYRVD